jgi:hypothetical protein
VVRSQDTLEQVRARGALALEADASEPQALSQALATATARAGLGGRRGQRRLSGAGAPQRR